MPPGRVFNVDSNAAELSALNAALATFPEQYKKDRLQFTYEQLRHSGVPAAEALVQARRITQ